MLCSRCQQREALLSGPDAEVRAKLEQLIGVPWPFPEDLCRECFRELAKDPEHKARMAAFTKAAGAKAGELIKKDLRDTVMKVLDFADRLVGDR
jgi:hypothetical protein